MEATYVNVSDLRLGSIVAEHIFANTQYPIVNKNTKITREHLQLFHVFQITQIPILKPQFSNTKASINDTVEVNDSEKQEQAEMIKDNSFRRTYDLSVQSFKKEFLNWQAGGIVDIAKLRAVIIPLIEQVLLKRSEILHLNSLSTPQDYPYHHSVAIGCIAACIAHKLGYEKGQVFQVATAALLADCGMSKIQVKIREKKAALTEAEYAEIRKHPIHSYKMVKDLQLLKQEMKIAIFQHHERLDGSGYPRGDKNVSVFSQIIAVADVYHAMTCERVYRTKESPFKVLEMIHEQEFGKFDIQVVNALTQIVTDLPVGTKAVLSNGLIGEVVFINPKTPTRPLIKIHETEEIIDLHTDRKLYIEQID